METYIFLGLVGLIRLVTGIVLLRLAMQQNLPNLKWLAWGLLSTVVAIPFTAQPYVPYVDKAIAYITYLCFALFIVQTFYQDKRSPLVPFWTVFTLLFIVMFWLTGRFMVEATGLGFPQHIFTARPPYADAPGSVPMGMSEKINSVIYGFLQIAIWLWHAIAGFQASRSIANDPYVEDWIKSRYQLIVTYSCLQSLIGVFMMIRPFASSTIVIFSVLLVITTTVMQYLVWVMPEWFRKWLNRNQQAREAELIHERALSILNILGSSMSEDTGLSKMLALFAIRKVIGTKINTEDTSKIEAYMISLGYDAWSAVLDTPELFNHIKSSGVNINPRIVIDKAIATLTEKQSLFTMQAK